MAARSTKGRKPTTGSEKPKKVRKRITEIPQLDDDKIYAEVLQGHFDDLTAESGNGKKSKHYKRRKTTAKRKWWWPKKPFETTPEREVLIGEIDAIYAANGYHRGDCMPHEYLETDKIRIHLDRLKAGLIPAMTKKGITNVKTSNDS